MMPLRRNGEASTTAATDLFPALDVASGLVIHSIQTRHRASKTPAINAWFAAHFSRLLNL